MNEFPFKRMNEEKLRDNFNVAINKEERIILENCKILLQQSKDSTALKQLAWIGAKTLQRSEIREINKIVMNNFRKNKRLGIVEFE